MAIDESPLSTNARIIDPPKLKYNISSLQPSIVSPNFYIYFSGSLYITSLRNIATKRWGMEYVGFLDHFGMCDIDFLSI